MSCHGSSVGVILRHRDTVLLIQRARGPQAGTWAVPAGHCESSELSIETGAREVSEEVGIDLNHKDLKMVYCGTHIPDECRHGTTHHDWTLFEAEVTTQDFVRNPDETLGALWVPVGDLNRMRLEPVMRRMLPHAGYSDVAEVPAVTANTYWDALVVWAEGKGEE